ncbi:hypothetical protein BaRGS_00001236 [Batillaria attramentaria]|uniref:Uncharacterized protein n=1 Tax=Batillaria attramentaria TaxID=370345 RepID=A0ABD0M7I4_9CAEN
MRRARSFPSLTSRRGHKAGNRDILYGAVGKRYPLCQASDGRDLFERWSSTLVASPKDAVTMFSCKHARMLTWALKPNTRASSHNGKQLPASPRVLQCKRCSEIGPVLDGGSGTFRDRSETEAGQTPPVAGRKPSGPSRARRGLFVTINTDARQSNHLLNPYQRLMYGTAPGGLLGHITSIASGCPRVEFSVGMASLLHLITKPGQVRKTRGFASETRNLETPRQCRH